MKTIILIFANFHVYGHGVKSFFADIDLSLNPPFGNREGGTGVVVTGPIFISTDNVTCIFGEQEVEGVVLSEDNVVLCTTPRLDRTGRIPVMIRHNKILLQKQARFYSGMLFAFS